jgi:hypothetical protein
MVPETRQSNNFWVFGDFSTWLLSVEESEALGGIEGWNKLEDPFFHGMAASRYFEPNLVTSRKIEGVMSSRSVLNEA